MVLGNLGMKFIYHLIWIGQSGGIVDPLWPGLDPFLFEFKKLSLQFVFQLAADFDLRQLCAIRHTIDLQNELELIQGVRHCEVNTDSYM